MYESQLKISYHASSLQVKHKYGLAKPLPVAALWPRVDGLPFHYDAHGAFMTLPRHTSTKEDNVQPVVSGALKHPAHAWGLVEHVGPGWNALKEKTSNRSVVLWHNYRLSASCDREPRSNGDDFIRQ